MWRLGQTCPLCFWNSIYAPTVYNTNCLLHPNQVIGKTPGVGSAFSYCLLPNVARFHLYSQRLEQRGLFSLQVELRVSV